VLARTGRAARARCRSDGCSTRNPSLMGVSTVISQRQLRNDNADVTRRVEQGETFVVTRHGRPVADLVPHLPSPAEPRRFVPITEPAVSYGALSPIATQGWYADRDELQTLIDDDPGDPGAGRGDERRATSRRPPGHLGRHRLRPGIRRAAPAASMIVQSPVGLGLAADDDAVQPRPRPRPVAACTRRRPATPPSDQAADPPARLGSPTTDTRSTDVCACTDPWAGGPCRSRT